MASVLGRQRSQQFGSVFHFPLIHAVPLKQERGPDGQVRAGVLIDRLDLMVIDELDARQSGSQLHSFYYRFDRSGYAAKRAECDGYSLRQRMQAKRYFSEDAQSSLRTYEQMCQIVSGGRFASATASLNHPAVSEYYRQA